MEKNIMQEVRLEIPHVQELKSCPKCNKSIGWIKRFFGISMFKRTWIKKESNSLNQHVKCKNKKCDFEMSYSVGI